MGVAEKFSVIQTVQYRSLLLMSLMVFANLTVPCLEPIWFRPKLKVPPRGRELQGCSDHHPSRSLQDGHRGLRRKHIR